MGKALVRERVRLNSSPASTGKSRRRVRLNDNTPTTRSKRVRLVDDATSKATASITPESLAYALPGGFAKLAYPKWMYNPFIRDIENKILKIAEGKQINVMFSAPPRHGKTMFIDRVLPAWYLGRFPDNRVLLITYQDGFSRTQSRHARNIFKRLGQSVFGLKVAEDTQAANQWDIQGHEGGMEAVGAGGAITGKGAHLLIIDDLIKGMEQATNETQLDEMFEWFQTDVLSRLEPGASVVIIMTRWTMSDVIGKILDKIAEDKENDVDDDDASFNDFDYVNYPALALENDVLGRAPGQALFPQRYDEKALRKIKNRNEEYWWEALYQGNPVPIRGNLIDISGFKRKYSYVDMPERKDFDMIVVSTDTAIKDTEIADYSVFGIWGVRQDGYYLLDIIRDKFLYPQLVDTAQGIHRTWHPEFFLIEDKGSGSSLIQDLQAEGSINVWPIDPGNESKVLRMQAETAVLKSGICVLPDEASWKDDFLLECRSFPRGKKDQVDMLSQFLKFMRQNTSGIEMF